MTIALDATYSLGKDLSGVGVYSREILFGLARSFRDEQFLWCYRPHRFFRSFLERVPDNCRRRPLTEDRSTGADLFHGLNQRLPRARWRRAVATFHDLFVLTGDYSTSEFRRRFAVQAREAADRADLIIAVSEFTARQVADLLAVERSRIHVIHHGVRFPVPGSPHVARERIILHVGAIQKRKNIRRLVEAFERVGKEWRLLLAGSSGYGAGEILRRIEESPRREDIEVLGHVPDQDLPGLYARASVFAFPSLDEGFGMPVLEAMAAGLPVISSNRSALPEVCGSAALLVDPNEVEALAEALERLTSDEALRCELAERGRVRARLFRWDAAVHRTWEVYRQLLL